MEIPQRRPRRNRRKNIKIEQLIILLSAVLAVFLLIALLLPNNDGETDPQLQYTEPSSPPSSSVVPPTSSVVTTPTTLPTDTFPPVTTPPATKPGQEYIGNLYTREELEKLDTEMIKYGPGKTENNKRPSYPLQMDEKYEKYDAHFIGPDNGKVYLTYTVTYEHEGNVQKTLDILKAKNIKAVFFVDKAFTRLYPELVRQIINDGHILANHCTTHPDLPTLSIDKIVKQIMDIHDYVLEQYGYEMRLFRPPSGYFSEQVWAIAQSLGYRSYQYSFTYADWDTSNQPNPQSSLNKLVNALHSGAIYYLHAVSSTNATILADFIDTARAQGYEFELLP